MPGIKKENDKSKTAGMTNELPASTSGSTGTQCKMMDSVYTIGEFAAESKALFGVTPELVEAALKNAGITKCTKEKAEKIVKSFVNREVK